MNSPIFYWRIPPSSAEIPRFPTIFQHLRGFRCRWQRLKAPQHSLQQCGRRALLVVVVQGAEKGEIVVPEIGAILCVPEIPISVVLGGVLPKSRCRFLHLDFGNTEVVPWDFGKKKLPISGCRNLHVDLGTSLTIIFYHDFSRNGFGVLHFEI